MGLQGAGGSASRAEPRASLVYLKKEDNDMKNISRRLLACLLGAALALAAPCALAAQATTAQIELVLEDGSQQALPV